MPEWVVAILAKVEGKTRLEVLDYMMRQVQQQIQDADLDTYKF